MTPGFLAALAALLAREGVAAERAAQVAERIHEQRAEYWPDDSQEDERTQATAVVLAALGPGAPSPLLPTEEAQARARAANVADALSMLFDDVAQAITQGHDIDARGMLDLTSDLLNEVQEVTDWQTFADVAERHGFRQPPNLEQWPEAIRIADDVYLVPESPLEMERSNDLN